MGMAIVLTNREISFNSPINMADGYINIVTKNCIWQRNKKYSYRDILLFSL